MARNTVRTPKTIETLRHDTASRSNIPTAEFHSVMDENQKAPVRISYELRNRDLDPQLVWRGKDEQDAALLTVQAPPLYIQEKLHPKVLIDDLQRRTTERRKEEAKETFDLFAEFNGLPSEEARTEFYHHDANWSNRMILGDSLQVMASLTEREGLRGKVQCIYLDPPYGIRFNSNFQWSTTSRTVTDGKISHITREPEQVKAFRDTWRDGIHSYLSYLRERLTVARELIAESGSIFVQIGEVNSHRVRALMDEVFGEENFIREIFFAKTGSLTSNFIGRTGDRILWYARNHNTCKFRTIFEEKPQDNFYKFIEPEPFRYRSIQAGDKHLAPSEIQGRIFRYVSMESADPASVDTPFEIYGTIYRPNKNSHWTVGYPDGMSRMARSGRLAIQGNKLRYRMYIDDYPVKRISDVWNDTAGFNTGQMYVVETRPKVIERCILMTSDPGDLVLDPTCGSGTSAYVAEKWGRRWITIDTSRVALALARARIMGASFPWFLLADSPEGRLKLAEITRRILPEVRTNGDIRQGFVYRRVPHITRRAIANNSEIDTIYDSMQPKVEKQLSILNAELQACSHDFPMARVFVIESGGRKGHQIDFAAPNSQTIKMPSGKAVPANALLEWEVPREAPEAWPVAAYKELEAFWKARIALQEKVDASIATNASPEYLYDKPYEDQSRVRVAGPFSVESVSPHRTLAVDENDELLCTLRGKNRLTKEAPDFTAIILENLKTSGIQQADKIDRITFSSLVPWPGKYICAEGRYMNADSANEVEYRAGIFIGPEFGTVTQPDLSAAAREVADAGFHLLIACGFNYDALAGDYVKLGRIPILKARMNADLHMAGDLKNTGKGNLFVVFGEPDIEVLDAGNDLIQVRINGVDVFHPGTGEIRSDSPDAIACWFVDTDYNEESFFVRHAYFLGANDPYKALKKSLKAEIDEDAWATLSTDISRPFPRPTSGRFAVKVINHLGDEVMKVYRA